MIRAAFFGSRALRQHRILRGLLVWLLLEMSCSYLATTEARERSLNAEGLNAYATGHIAEALLAWHDASEAGDASAALFLGAMYDTGQGVPQSYEQALSWYVRAADAGSAAAMFNVGVMHDAGLGIPQDQAAAARWYACAAAQGYGRADYALALMYRDGSGVRRDPAHAAELFRDAEQHGITAARGHLKGFRRGNPGYSDAGRSTTGRFGDARDTALRDFAAAQSALLRRKPADTVEDATLYRSAAEAHNPVAEYDLGYCYEKGFGVPPDSEQATIWYQRASDDAKDVYLRGFAAAAAHSIGLQARIAPGQVNAPGGMAAAAGDAASRPAPGPR